MRTQWSCYHVVSNSFSWSQTLLVLIQTSYGESLRVTRHSLILRAVTPTVSCLRQHLNAFLRLNLTFVRRPLNQITVT